MKLDTQFSRLLPMVNISKMDKVKRIPAALVESECLGHYEVHVGRVFKCTGVFVRHSPSGLLHWSWQFLVWSWWLGCSWTVLPGKCCLQTQTQSSWCSQIKHVSQTSRGLHGLQNRQNGNGDCSQMSSLKQIQFYSLFAKHKCNSHYLDVVM